MSKNNKNGFRQSKEYLKFMKNMRVGVRDKSVSIINIPDYKIENSIALSNSISGSCFKKDFRDYKWKRGKEESKETIQEIENKANRTAPMWNKGAYQFISSEEDLTKIGKKI